MELYLKEGRKGGEKGGMSGMKSMGLGGKRERKREVFLNGVEREKEKQTKI